MLARQLCRRRQEIVALGTAAARRPSYVKRLCGRQARVSEPGGDRHFLLGIAEDLLRAILTTTNPIFGLGRPSRVTRVVRVQLANLIAFFLLASELAMRINFVCKTIQ